MELYQIEEVSFTYPGAEFPALSQLTLKVKQGEFVVLCGESGCGKTTLLRLLKPAIAPAGTKAGRISFCKTDLNQLDPRTAAGEIGFVMQNPENQIVTDKVWHELAFGLENLGVPTAEIRARVSEMAAFFGMDGWFHKRVEELSGGQKQQLHLAAVMVLRPKVLILDEPTGQLDPIAAQEFLQMLSRINRELGTTVILSEHRLEEAIPLADRVLVLDGGRLIADAKPKELGGILKNHAIYHALPTPIRIHDAIEKETECPLTVRDGRLWLEEYATRNRIQKERIPRHNDAGTLGKTVLEVKDAWFRYQKDGEDVLRGFSVQIRQGEIYALLGGNGAGKTTALSLMAGLEMPQRGKVLVEGKPLSQASDLYRGIAGVLPQDPKTLFVHKTVYLDFMDFPWGGECTEQEKEERIRQVSMLCRIEHLLGRHPYDLSGGEQERIALAKLLLQMPKILLLDEPTKGMDVAFKQEFAEILQDLKRCGVTIVMVSHDIEFCAEFADRCGLLFDGEIITEGVPRQFFAGKTFYTTAASRMAGGVLPEAILAKDVILACGGEVKELSRNEKKSLPPPPRKDGEEPAAMPRKKSGIYRGIFGVLWGILFVLTCGKLERQPSETEAIVLQIMSILELGACLFCFFYQKQKKEPTLSVPRERLSVRTCLGALFILLAVPLTVYMGMTYFQDRKYYLISILILIETMVPFLALWEKRKNTARELVIVSVLCAIAVGGRMAFSFLPQFKPVLALVILTGVCLGGETGFLVGAVTAFVSNFFLGQGAWTPWQMLATGMVGFLAGILFGTGFLPKRRGLLCLFGFLGTILIYGGIMNPASVLLYQENPNGAMFVTAYMMGLPFDLIHGVSTAFFLWMLQRPIEEKLSRIKIKYGLTEEV